jgi:hypothetical protein
MRTVASQTFGMVCKKIEQAHARNPRLRIVSSRAVQTTRVSHKSLITHPSRDRSWSAQLAMTTRLQLCFLPTALILSTSDFSPLDEPYIAMGVGDKPAVYNFREFCQVRATTCRYLRLSIRGVENALNGFIQHSIELSMRLLSRQPFNQGAGKAGDHAMIFAQTIVCFFPRIAAGKRNHP